jgi:hypothetical protein
VNHAHISTLYSGRATNWVALGLTTALTAPLLLMAGPWSKEPWTALAFVVPLAIAAVATLANLLTLCSIRTLAGPNGVSIYFGAFGWPRYHYPLAKIQEAEAVLIANSWWAWGVSWSPRRGLVLAVRNGPALQLTLTNNRRVTISTPHPDEAVGAIASAIRAARVTA